MDLQTGHVPPPQLSIQPNGTPIVHVVTEHQWIFLQFIGAQTKLGTKIDLALFADAKAEVPTLVAIPVGPAVDDALRAAVGALEIVHD